MMYRGARIAGCSAAFKDWLQLKQADMSRDNVVRLAIVCFREHRNSKGTNVPFDFQQLFSDHPVQNKQVPDPIEKQNDPDHLDSEQQDRQDVDKEEEPPAPKLGDESDSLHTDDSRDPQPVQQLPEESRAPDESGPQASSSQQPNDPETWAAITRRLQKGKGEQEPSGTGKDKGKGKDHLDSEQLLPEASQAQDLNHEDITEETQQL